jgi:chloride channel 7
MLWLWSFPGNLQIFGSIGSVGGGLALGKEGPLVHTGACIASLLGQVSTCGLRINYIF